MSNAEQISGPVLRALPKNDDGAHVCPSCQGPINPERPWCSTCVEAREREWKRDEATLMLSDAWSATLTTLPRWPWARFDNAAWRDRCDRRALNAARAWRPGRGLVLLGPTGSGKSSAMVASIRHNFDRAKIAAAEGRFEFSLVVWAREQTLAADQRAHPLGRGHCRSVADAIRARCLVLDELGPANASQLMFEVLDGRYARGLRTVVTSGLTVDEIKFRYGDAFFRRIVTGADVVDMHSRGSK